VVKDSVGTFVTKIIVMFLTLFVGVILARSLGAAGKGQLAIIVLLPQILWILGSLGLDMSNIYFAGREPETRPKLVANSVWLGLIFGTVAVVIVLAGYMLLHLIDPSIEKQLLGVPPYLFLLMFLTVPMFLVAYFVDSVVYGMDRIHVRNIKEILTNVFSLILTLIFVTDPSAHWPLFDTPFGFGLNMGLYGATITQLAITAFMLIYALWLVSKFVKWDLFRFDWGFFIKGLKHIGFYAYGATAATFLFYKASMLVIAFYIAHLSSITDVDLGLYTTASNISEKVWFIPGAIVYALLPKVTSFSSDEIKILTGKASRHTFLITLVILTILSIFIRPILVFLYTEEFVTSCYTFWALVPGVLVLSMGKVYGTHLLGIGKAYYAFWFSIITLVVNIVLNIIFLPKYGIVGSAVATSVSYTIQTIMLYWAFKREVGIPIYDLFFFRTSDWVVYQKGFGSILTYLKRKNG
jgi:O-antigen/teichoic acid export membrane protein